ncbi:MAG TPA: DUF5666 domain-containing protein [Chloroflexia bacterium]|nr:DUF5666 domain-containing protein [Chloroflexia bacterium]
MSRLISLVLVALALLLAGCGQQAAGSAEDEAAREAFLKERAGTPTPGFAADMVDGKDFPGTFGEVEKVEGSELTIKNPATGETTVVRLAEGGVVHKQASATLSDVKVGDKVMAAGKKDGDTLTADVVNVGGEGGGTMGAGPVQIRRPSNGQGPGTNSSGGAVTGGRTPVVRGEMLESVTGTVTKVDGNTITVEAEDGTTATVEVTSDTRFRKQVEVPLSEIETGTQVAAQGEMRGGVFEATEISVMEMMVIQR